MANRGARYKEKHSVQFLKQMENGISISEVVWQNKRYIAGGANMGLGNKRITTTVGVRVRG